MSLKPLVLLTVLLSLYAFAESPPLVFIHGIKGAKLVDKNGNLQWISGLQALGLSTPDLALPLSWTGGRQGEDDLRPKEILDTVPIVPFLYEPMVYGKWLKAAAGFSTSFYPFAYDWRRENSESVEKLERFLESLHTPARVVAHSLGGLITLSLLNRRPELFRSVVFAGVPFAGGIGFLPDLMEGTATGLNKKILSPAVLATFPSLYAFFPETSQNLVRADGTPASVDFYSAESWEKNRLGLYAQAQNPPEGFKSFLKEALAKAKKFRASLIPTKVSFPPVLVVNSRSVPTLSRAQAKPGDKVSWDFTNLPKEGGDGRVIQEHSLPPPPIPYDIFISEKDHADLLNDPKVIERLRTFP